MKKTRFTKLLSITLCIVLIAAMALFATGCNDNTNDYSVMSGVMQTYDNETIKLGKGDTSFDFTVFDKDGKQTRFEIFTNKTTVGEALLELELISGEQGDYGLYVKTVNGITLDFDTDGMYWAFYVNGEYGMTGVDKTEIKSGETYSFKASR